MKRIFLPLVVVLSAAMIAQAGPDLTSARIYRNQGDLAKAVDFFNLELEKSPDSYVAYYERGEVFGMIAMDATKKGVLRDLAGDSENPQKEMLRRMMADFDKVKAVEDEKAQKKLKKELKKIEKIIDDYWAEFYNESVTIDTLHTAAIASGDTTKAEASVKRILAVTDICLLLKPEEWNAYAVRAQVLDRAQRIEEANEAWTQAKAILETGGLSEENEEAWGIIQAHRLQNYYNADNYDKAIEVANEIQVHDPENIDALVFEAFSYTNKVNAPELSDEEKPALRDTAIAALLTAFEATPEDAAMAFYLGQFNLANTDTAEALEWYHKYTELDTTDQEVIFHLGYLYLDGGTFKDLAKAEGIYQTMVDRFPDNCDAWINLGVAQINQEKNKEGADNVNKGKACKEAKKEE